MDNVLSPIPGPSVMLYGPIGTGKTHALQTLIDAGITPCVIFTEPRMDPIAHIKCPDLHWMYIAPTTGSWEGWMEKANIMTDMSWNVMKEMTSDKNKTDYLGFYRMMAAMHQFKCDRCGVELGDVSTWPTNKAIAIDGMSGINRMAFQLIAGEPVARTIPQWGAAMNAELSIVEKLNFDCHCTTVVIAHPSREVDVLHGGTVIKPSVLGKAMTDEFPKSFSDVVYTIREGKDFYWSTAHGDADTKATNLPIAEKLLPSFEQLINSWKSKGGIIEREGIIEEPKPTENTA